MIKKTFRNRHDSIVIALFHILFVIVTTGAVTVVTKINKIAALIWLQSNYSLVSMSHNFEEAISNCWVTSFFHFKNEEESILQCSFADHVNTSEPFIDTQEDYLNWKCQANLKWIHVSEQSSKYWVMSK